MVTSAANPGDITPSSLPLSLLLCFACNEQVSLQDCGTRTRSALAEETHLRWTYFSQMQRPRRQMPRRCVRSGRPRATGKSQRSPRGRFFLIQIARYIDRLRIASIDAPHAYRRITARASRSTPYTRARVSAGRGGGSGFLGGGDPEEEQRQRG